MGFARERVSLLGKFSVLSALAVALLAVVVGQVLERQMQKRALTNAEESASLIAKTLIEPNLTHNDIRFGASSEERYRVIDLMLRADQLRQAARRIKIFNPKGRVVYSTDRSDVGRPAGALGESLRGALAGTPAVELSQGVDDSSETDGGEQLLEAYIPLRPQAGGPTEGAFELYLPYAPVAEAVREDTRNMYLLLLAGFALLYGLLYRIVSGASRRLRDQADENRTQLLQDVLTGLPNRKWFNAELADRIDGGREGADAMVTAVLLVDLDRFRDVNDTLGHHNGDLLLQEVARRLREVVRRGDALARLGGDEFGLILSEAPHRGATADFSVRLRAALARPFAVEGVVVSLDASIGVSLFPEHGDHPSTLVRRADVALGQAKRSHSDVVTYAPERDPYTPDRLALAAELRQALATDQLVLHYQPKLCLDGGKVTGVEALLRWHHPERGLIPPDDFIPLAERTGLSRPLTLHVLELALAQVRRWQDEGRHMRVALNLAGADVVDPQLPDAVAERLRHHGVPAACLEVEITESTVIGDPAGALGVLSRLREMGIRVALDDFGTGQSSLAYLKRLPIDELKIDRSFVMGMSDDESDAVIVRSTIDLARNLGLDVVAEGVENAEAWNDLAALGCDTAQGFFMSRALPAAELDQWLSERPAPPDGPLPELIPEAGATRG